MVPIILYLFESSIMFAQINSRCDQNHLKDHGTSPAKQYTISM